MLQVSERALMARINRKLAQEGEHMHRTRGARWRGDLGDYYIADTKSRALVAWHCTPEGVGREIGVLRPDETVIST